MWKRLAMMWSVQKMKIDPKIQEKVMKEIRSDMRDYYRKTKVDISLMKDAETVERFMELKQDLLRHVVQMMPFLTTHCYFCMLHETEYSELDCPSCEYGKVHGICRGDTEGTTDFSKVSDARVALWNAIDDKYYSGEEYDNVNDVVRHSPEKEPISVITIHEDKIREVMREHSMTETNIEEQIEHGMAATFAMHMDDFLTHYWDDALDYAFEKTFGDDDGE
jgi:hypothetical protein